MRLGAVFVLAGCTELPVAGSEAGPLLDFAAPCIALSEGAVPFGELRVGEEEGFHRLMLENPCSGVLRISEVELTTEDDEDVFDVQPWFPLPFGIEVGGCLPIDVVVRPTYGPAATQLRIASNDPNFPEEVAVLSVEGVCEGADVDVDLNGDGVPDACEEP
ncbi:MAG: hypothetical protein AAF211_29835 [Myxococcota bacterium]